jgi:hypothetical protein
MGGGNFWYKLKLSLICRHYPDNFVTEFSSVDVFALTSGHRANVSSSHEVEHLYASLHPLANIISSLFEAPRRNRTHPTFHFTLLPICLSNSHLPSSVSVSPAHTLISFAHTSDGLSLPRSLYAAYYIHCEATTSLYITLYLRLIYLPLFLSAFSVRSVERPREDNETNMTSVQEGAL